MPWTPAELAARLASEMPDGWIVNLGVGMPTLVAAHLAGRQILVHAENGVLGVGPPPPPDRQDPDVIDPGKNPVTILPGASFMDSAVSFGLIRGGRLDLAVMGAYQVSQDGDLANWRLPDRRGGAIGGAADLAAGAQRVWVMTSHLTKEGTPKLVKRCTYPLTAPRVVTRIYTDMAVLEVASAGFRALALAPGVSFDDLRAATAAPIEIAA
jgi:3-oxoacid CoA-transferase B subunit